MFYKHRLKSVPQRRSADEVERRSFYSLGQEPSTPNIVEILRYISSTPTTGSSFSQPADAIFFAKSNIAALRRSWVADAITGEQENEKSVDDLGWSVAVRNICVAFPTISKVTASMFTDDDPDVPRRWKNAMSKEEYMLRREENIALLRGIGTGLPVNPALRMQAIRQLDEQQKRLLNKTGLSTGTAGAGSGLTGPQSPSAPAALASIGGTWNPIGPFPIPNGQTVGVSTAVSGRTVAIAVHPTNPNIAYVGTAQGGLYRTTNGGSSWTPLMDNALSLAIGTLTLAPSNPEILSSAPASRHFPPAAFRRRHLSY